MAYQEVLANRVRQFPAMNGWIKISSPSGTRFFFAPTECIKMVHACLTAARQAGITRIIHLSGTGK